MLSCAVMFTALVLCSAPHDARAAARCQSLRVPVSAPGISGASVYAELCSPGTRAPRTVQLLVPGATYNHYYWDWPLQPDRYSYARKALAAGYATLVVDRLGSGISTRPLSELLTLDAGAATLHQLIDGLRSGAVGGHSFARVVWVGHSLGSTYGWMVAAKYPRDVDAFVLTGMLHHAKASYLSGTGEYAYPAAEDPKFAGEVTDVGYITTRPGRRDGLFYYAAGADPATIARDEELKDTAAVPETAEGVEHMMSPPPETEPSRSITVPTLLAVGDHDQVFCDPPDGLSCNAADIARVEAPYYSPGARLAVQVAPDSGHDMQLHRSSPASTDRILDWIGGVVAP